MSEALNLKKTSKHGILDLWEVQLKNYTGELHCSLPGLEFLVPPYAVHEIHQNHKAYKVDPRSVVVFNSPEGHVEQFVNTNASLKALVIGSDYISDLCQPLNIKAQEIEFNPCEVSQDKELTEKIKLLAELSDPSVDPTEFSLDCFTSDLLITTLTRQKHSKSETFAKDLGSGYFPGAIPRIKTVLHQNIENPAFNLDVLAKESGLSKFHLIRVFKKNVGTSPAKYLSQIKIDLAKHWLLKSKKTVLSIAMDLGFSDLSTFNKAFKKALGVSPSGFRLRY
jgi:AraC-like DNA-binding protein